ncbi:MAG: hypothetical protein RI907_1792 [Pseudomonadota bacterium]
MPSHQLFRPVVLCASLLMWGASHATQASHQPDQFARNFDGLHWTDTAGRNFLAQSLTGQVVLYHFIYTGCATVCPTQTQALTRVVDGLPAHVRNRVRIVSVSIDPWGDTAAGLRAYARRLGADRPRWQFVRASVQDTDQLAQRLRLWPRTAPGRAAEPTTHTTALWLVDPQGRLRMRYDGRQPDVRRLTQEIAALATAPHPSASGT